jgi:hypothetical protein
MRRVWLFCVVILAVVLGGCVQPWMPTPKQEGIVRVAIHTDAPQSSTISPAAIPSRATHVRIRVWHPTTGFNAVRTVALGGTGSTASIPVPQGGGYLVDAVSYYVKRGRALALTGGRSLDVTVSADDTTNVEIELRPWSTHASGDTTVKPGESYSVEFEASDAGGLLTRETFRSATLHAATTTFQNADSALPLYPGTAGVVFDDRVVFSSVAPSVTSEVTLYVGALVEFVQNWNDTTRTNADEFTLFLELPNRHMEAALHQIIVDPATGGIVIVITGNDH